MTSRPLLDATPVNTLPGIPATAHPAVRWWAWLLCTVGLVLAGCSSPAPTRFYTLAPLSTDVSPLRTDIGAVPPDTLNVRIWVAPSRLPTVLDREQWVVRRGGTELQILEQQRWGQGLRDEIDQALADHLAMALRQQMPPQSNIAVTTGKNMSASSILHLYVEVLRFDTLLQPQARVQDELRWTLRCAPPDSGTAKPLERNGVFQSGLRDAKPVNGLAGEDATPYNAVVASHSQNLQAMGAQVAQAVATLAKPCGEQQAAARQP